MPDLRIPNVGKAGLLQDGLTADWEIRLFKTDVSTGLTPAQVDGLVSGDFTEADFPGYSAVSLPSAGWSVGVGAPAIATHSEASFVRSSTGAVQEVYGFYLVEAAGGAIRAFRQWSAPKLLELANDTISVTPALFLSDSQGDMMHVGSSVDFRGATAPDGWLLEDGSAVSRTTYADLFAVIGTTYGPGDGSTTFNLPDSRGRFRLGKSAAGTGATLGETGGALDHTHGLDGTDAHARIYQSGSTTKHERLGGLPTYTANVSYSASGGVAVTDAATQGSRLGGSTQGDNPAFLSANSIIKY